MLKKGLKAKLIVSLVASILFVLILFFVFLNFYLTDYSRNESEKDILYIGQRTASILQKPLFNSDYNHIKSIATSIVHEDIDYLIIYDNISGNIAFNQDEKDSCKNIDWDELFKDRLSFESEKKNIFIDGEKYTQFLFPVSLEGVSKPLGFLVIGVSKVTIQSKLAAITYRLLLISVLLFLALAVTVYILSGKIVKPIKRLSLKIGRFAAGDYTVRYPVKSNDEIGDLAESFNTMADTINEQIASIEQYNKNLEKMVEDRTDELLKALDAIKEKDKKLNQAEKINSLHSIVSSIAHEINNPLTIISGNLQIIETKSDDDVIKKKLLSAHAAIKRIDTLIDEINFFSAIKKEIYLKSLHFSSILTTCVDRVVPEEIELSIESVENDQVTSNQNLLALSLENILQNSVEQIQLLEIPGNIKIKYYRETYYLVVEITDNAGGFQDTEKVFDPFYTTFNEKKGLGLTFAYHAMQALNGEIYVENIDNGAKITLKIPESETFEEKE